MNAETWSLFNLGFTKAWYFCRQLNNVDMRSDQTFFRQALLTWATEHLRPMPWKGEKNPYRIWISEIILQQTRVDQGWAYYERFIEQFPTVQHLAEAPEEVVLKAWQGLGYYARARNLHASARYIHDTLQSRFPSTYEDILALKGVGAYTAAAIASFGFGLPYAVLDGNVYRILARFFGIDTPIDHPQAKKKFEQLAQELLDQTQPGVFNQAMMDFGAIQCTPQQTQCTACPMQSHCKAFLSGRVQELPIKSKKTAKKQRFFLYVIFRSGDQVLIRQRTSQDIWKGLFEFPALEPAVVPIDKAATTALIFQHFFPNGAPENLRIDSYSDIFRQILTHRIVSAAFCTVYLQDGVLPDLIQTPAFQGCYPVSIKTLDQSHAFPKIIASNLSNIINVSFFKLF